MFIVVAIIAVIVAWGFRWERHKALRRLRESYSQLAQKYAKAGWQHHWRASLGGQQIVTFGDARGYRTVRLESSEMTRVAEDEGRMRVKYELAAASPWLPVEPDPQVSELERLADEKGSPLLESPPPWPLAIDLHPMRP